MSVTEATANTTGRATCKQCGQQMNDGTPCTWMPTVSVEGRELARIPYGPPPSLETEPEHSRRLWALWPDGWPASCTDCAAPQGALHHPGCHAERCPGCLGQAIGCECEWEDPAEAAS